MRGAKSKSLAFTGLLLNCLELIFSANTGFSVSIYDVTSQSISLRWPKFSGASSYRVTATAVNTVGHSLLAHFSDVTIKATLTSLIPNTVYAIQAEAIDKNGIILAETQIMQSTAPDIPVIDQAYSKLSNSITVEWRAVPGATSYMLTAQDGDSFIETVVKNSPGTVMGLKPATLYRITIRSINSGGKSQPSPFRKAKTVLAAPILSVSSPSCDSIALSWKAVYMAAGFSVSLMRSDGLGGMLRENTTNTSLIFTNLDPGTLYTIKAYAWNANGMPGDDFTYNQRTSPNAPADVKVAFNSGALRVSWMPTEGALTYSVTASSGLLKLKCNTSSSSCMVPSLQCSSEYDVSVTAYNDAGSSKPTDAVSLKTIPCAPVNISIKEDKPGHLLVSWSSVSFGHYYVVFVKSDDGLEVHCNTSYTQCYFQSDCGFTYFISVFAYNKAGQSPLGDVFNYTTAPCCPSDFRAVFVSSDTVRVTWAPVRGADLYETRAAAWSTVVLCNDTAPACTLSALQCNTRYHITVHSFSEARGSNTSCAPKHVATAPCSPEIKNVSKEGLSVISVQWQSNNEDATYVVTARGEAGLWHCTSTGSSCTLTDLPCGSAFSVSAIARSPAGQSLPSYSVPLETAPCCPNDLILTQVTQSVTNISWSAGKGAQTYVTTLESPKGQAKCRTLQNYCLLGCITCGTNYTMSLKAISETGLTSSCTYQGYSSSACCPSGVKLYRLSNNGIRVFWRASDETINYSTDLHGSKGNFTCTPSTGRSHCDITEIPCGDVYTVVVAPLTDKGLKLTFCPKKIYSVTCSGSSLGMVIYRGKSNAEHI
ncbi:fibronectin type III domain-containing protein 7 isoform X1 [Corapipo altera]|uniref:fibronectin type III domain-containing protein 7 isoform X1 n=1 Tax=Corapipo altera TaxID=415028 RepID=UPI000FD639E4|nr:fibronectin type III domain-containing protein 7 isoform X1 [Corapipo altera]XP_027521862.1 fibronectin type III domain-containing protein 7 isoform X1 [Corapipo altera]XP_027521864.1 fibronectin type III domain-containing protein 7 isoform X1 [Corapipo altera]XP_027521865.1 fibronectin type III domain-containing protein 7 isoform X1 [Corapipo altera]